MLAAQVIEGFQPALWSGNAGGNRAGTKMDLNAMLTLMRDNLDVLIAVLSAAVAITGALLSRAETRRQRMIQLENLRHGVDAQSMAWGNHCIDVLNRAAMFARTRQHQQNDASFLQQRVNLMLAVSSLVERGRLFFPNVGPGSRGADKEGAYRGARPPILDALMFAYYELESLSRTDGPTADNSAEFIADCRRLLVSELQAHLDPRRRDTVIGRYDDQRLEHRKDAIAIAESLKTRLKSRRPGLQIDAHKETVQ
ncbi:MAG: hypothetical protein QNI84_14270 [Henriciella sp.]|nr:hypothetical protein [Henriciella sp.]